MTVKLVAFLKKRSDLDREDFIAWYEANHVPTIREVTPGLVDYRRNYLPETIGGADVITELTYASREAFDHAMDIASKSPASDRIAADQAHLFDPEGIRITLVEERTQ